MNMLALDVMEEQDTQFTHLLHVGHSKRDGGLSLMQLVLWHFTEDALFIAAAVVVDE